jgi:hypothetical protein
MNEVITSALKDFFTSLLKNLFASVSKQCSPLKLKIKHQRESKKATFTVEIDNGNSCYKCEIQHEKSNSSFFIGFLFRNDDDKPQLFISVDNVHLIWNCKYLYATQTCNVEVPSNEEGEVWYTAAESINKEYFSETTSETRKDEIIEQILTEVVKSLNDQCSSNEETAPADSA